MILTTSKKEKVPIYMLLELKRHRKTESMHIKFLRNNEVKEENLWISSTLYKEARFAILQKVKGPTL